MNTNYRVHAAGMLEGLAADYKVENLELYRILDDRSRASGEVVAEIISRTSDCDQLLASHVHMFLNRLFVSNPRQHELLVYYYLEKYYRGGVERRKQSSIV